MSQLLGFQSADCLFIAADRRVVQRDSKREQQVSQARKLYRLGPKAVIATSGAAIGIEVSKKLSQAISQGLSLEFKELEEYAVTIFRREYEAFTQEGADWFAQNPDAHRLSYFLLGGRDIDGSLQMRFYGSESHEAPHEALQIGAVLSAPRRLGLEMRLSQAINRGASTEELRQLATTGLEQIANHDENVGKDYDCALFTNGELELFTCSTP